MAAFWVGLARGTLSSVKEAAEGFQLHGNWS
jgi:hypothetical protein